MGFMTVNIIKILPIARLELYAKEDSLVILTYIVKKILFFLKNHFKYQFKSLTCISGLDYPENYYWFQIVYELLSIKYNFWLWVKLLTNELIPVSSVEKIYLGASWWECEIWDMFGVFFLDQYNLTWLLTDYGFQGYPLWKDFPLSGFIESRYHLAQNRVVYEQVELAQEYRTFDYSSPWEKLV